MRSLPLLIAAFLLAVPASALGSGPPVRAAATVDVQVDDYFFRPAYARIEPGDSVLWRVVGADVHNVTSRAGSAEPFASADLIKGEQFERSFPNAGRYAYHCTIHPQMRGVVQVGPDTIAPKVTKLKAKVGKQRVRVTFRLSEASKVTGTLASVKKPKKVLRRAGGKKLEDGAKALLFKTSGLASGRYRVMVTVKDPGANTVKARIAFKLPAAD
jgi:plastocyanin